MRTRVFHTGAAVCFALMGTAYGAVPINSLKITEKAGATTANYPIQVGRPFVPGEIAHYPQALVNGAAVTTQADVKQRWADGTVKHAVVSFLIPQLSAGSTVTVTFRDQSSGQNTPLTPAAMLGANFNFNAHMVLGNGTTTATADARQMLSADAFTRWTSGSVAETIILADHSTGRTYDLGFDANRSFRPIFHATFWPGVNKVRVRFVGENASTEALQNVTYSLALKTGNSPSTQIYSKATFEHAARTRWTKEFWIGGAPPAIAIDHNLSYVRETRFIPYYDTNRVPSAAVACNQWSTAVKDIGDPGNWTKNMTIGGARPDIGPYPDWTVRWIYTGDKCAQDQALGNADLSASWPVHVREGKAGRNFLRTDAVGANTALGRVLSITARPTMSTVSWNYGAVAADQIIPVGTVAGLGWTYDPAHEPEVASAIYALTGDFWYLEEMWFWASFDAASGWGKSPFHRGPTGVEGALNHGQLRGMAWQLRNRVNTAYISPDGTLEKTYLEALINDAIALEEGARNITTTSFNGNPVWNWGRTQFAPAITSTSFSGMGPTPLHQWSRGNNTFAQSEYGICSLTGSGTPCGPTTSEAASLFESHYMLYALGRTVELGYPANALLSWLGSLYTGMLTDPGFNPYIIENGRVPTVKSSDGSYFQTFAELKTGYNPAWQTKTSFNTLQNQDGYGAYASAAISYLANEPKGAQAWAFMLQNFYNPNGTMHGNPKWAIVPRNTTTSPGTPPPPTPTPTPTPVSCDVNKDSKIDVLDVQLSIDQSLGKTACSSDLDGNGKCDVIDVQRVINAALGSACLIG